jgi:HlyD family secretion protein
MPGLSADIEVILDARDDVLRVPTYAILEGNRVLAVKGGKLESVAVETGLRNWEFTEIASGVSEGDQVVVSLDRAEVKAGARVEVTAGKGS